MVGKSKKRKELGEGLRGVFAAAPDRETRPPTARRWTGGISGARPTRRWPST